ncbi:MAG: hypothetical protein ABEJ79_00345 [Halolamina sp.]
MSANPDTAGSETQSDGYARRNWWGEHDTDAERRKAERQDSHHDHGTRSKADWLAHALLKATAPRLLDPISLEEDGTERELSAPELYVEPSRVEDADGQLVAELYGDHRRHRYEPETGHITGPKIDDRPTDEFLEVVDTVLRLAKQNEGLRDTVAERIRALAERGKENQGRLPETDMTDVRIMSDVIRCIDDPTALADLEKRRRYR